MFRLAFGLFSLFLSLQTEASTRIPIGFNQAWFKNQYASQYLDYSYDEREVTRIFHLASQAGAKTLRLWFFESTGFPQLIWNDGHIIGIQPDFVKNVIRTLRIAREHQIQVYMTLLDPQVYRPDQLSCTELKRLKNLLTESGGQEFLQLALAPLLKEIDLAGLSDQISKIDLANEGDAAVDRFAFEHGWVSAARFLCQWRSFIHQKRGFEKTPVTFSIRLSPLLPLPLHLFDQKGPMACADFYDFHSYADSGQIHLCGVLKHYASLGTKKLVLGEFGQNYFTHKYSDELQTKNTRNYLTSSEKCGFSEALAWRLSDIRDGYNPEARYSFEAFGTTRPAFQIISNYNQGK
jgi:hypothetical protein